MTTLEKWENVGGNGWVNKFDPMNPGKVIAERVRAGRSFYITPEERNLLNSDRISKVQRDPFKNGTFRPIKGDALEEARAEEEAIAEAARQGASVNPNHMSDEELAVLYSAPTFEDFMAGLNSITSAAVVQRLLKLSENPEYQAKVAQVRAVEARLGELGEKTMTDVVEVDQVRRVGSVDDDRPTGVQSLKI